MFQFDLLEKLRSNPDEWVEGNDMDAYKEPPEKDQTDDDYKDSSKPGGWIVVKVKKVIAKKVTL